MAGILRVRQDVEDRREVERNPDGLELRRERAREPLGQRVVATATERHHRRPDGERRLEPRHPPAFLIDAHPERQLLRQRLRLARDLGDLIGSDDVAREENDATEIELTRERSEIRRDGIAGEPGNRELADVTTNVAKGHVLLIIATDHTDHTDARILRPPGNAARSSEARFCDRRASRNVTQSVKHAQTAFLRDPYHEIRAL